MNIAVKLPQVVLGLAFLGAEGSKLAGADQMVDDFERFRYPQWFRVATGAVEVGGARASPTGADRVLTERLAKNAVTTEPRRSTNLRQNLLKN